MHRSAKLFVLALGATCFLPGCSAPVPSGQAEPVAAEQPAAPATPAARAIDETQPAGSPREAKPPVTADADPGLYTDLEGAACALVSVDREAGGSTRRCPGVQGYQLLAQDSDARMSIDVVAPGGERTPLQLASLAGGGAFSSLGPRAEWRPSDGSAPTALIVRFNVFEQPEQPDRPTSYLVVARLAGGKPCAVGRVAPGPAQNQRARQMADGAAGLPCLQAGG